MKIRTAVLPKSESCCVVWVGWFFFLERRAKRNLSMDSKNRAVAGDRLHFYMTTDGGSDFLLLSRGVVDCIGTVQGMVTEKRID